MTQQEAMSLLPGDTVNHATNAAIDAATPVAGEGV